MERKMKKKQVGLTTLAATLMISGMTLTQVNAKDELKVTMPDAARADSSGSAQQAKHGFVLSLRIHG